MSLFIDSFPPRCDRLCGQQEGVRGLLERPAAHGTEFQDGHPLRGRIMGSPSWGDAGHAGILDADFLAAKGKFLSQTVVLHFQAEASVDTVDRPATRVGRRVLGQREDVQHGQVDLARPRMGKRDSRCSLGGHRVLVGFSSRSHSEHDNINQVMVFRQIRCSRKNRWTSTGLRDYQSIEAKSC